MKYYSLKQAHIEADIKNIVSIEVLTKNQTIIQAQNKELHLYKKVT